MICSKRRASDLEDIYDLNWPTCRKRRFIKPNQNCKPDNDYNELISSDPLDIDSMMEDAPPTTLNHDENPSLENAHVHPPLANSTRSPQILHLDGLQHALRTFTSSNPQIFDQAFLPSLQPHLIDLISTAGRSDSTQATTHSILATLSSELHHLQHLAFQQVHSKAEAVRLGIGTDDIARIEGELKSLDETIVGLSALVAALEAEVNASTTEQGGRKRGMIDEDWSGRQSLGIAAL